MSESQDADEVDAVIEVEFSTVSATRLKAFSDAVWSIIATIMIVPTMHINVNEELKLKKKVAEVVKETLPQVGLYALAFLIVCTTWGVHVWTFQTMRKVTDLSLVINLVILLGGSFLPYFYSLMARFKTWRTVIMYAAIQIGIGLCQLLIVHHAFSYPDLLTKKMHEMTEKVQKRKKGRIISHIVVAPAFALVAIGLSFASVKAAIVCLAMILVYPWIQSFLLWAWSKIKKCRGKQYERVRNKEQEVLLTERIKKERIEAFNDGVFAITSTLLVLDITEKYLPTKKLVTKTFGGHVMNALEAYWGVFLSYVMTFMLIGLIWYTQLHMFKNYLKISRLMLFISNWIAACVGVIPLAFTFVLHFTIPEAVRVGLQFGSAALFMIGFFTTLMYIVAMLFDKCRKNETWVAKAIKPGGKEFGKTLFQMVSPMACSALVFGLSFLENYLIAAYVGGPLLVVYGFILVFWRTIQATFFDDETSDNRGDYRALKLAEDIDEEVRATGKEE